MILKQLGLVRMIFNCVLTMASYNLLVGGAEKDLGSLLKEDKPSFFERPLLNSFHPAPEGFVLQVEGCQVGKDILRVGEHRQTECGRLECQSPNGTAALLYHSCVLPSDHVEDGCTILPPTSLEFPKCCIRMVVCHVTEVTEVPVVYTPPNINRLEKSADTQHPKEEKDGLKRDTSKETLDQSLEHRSNKATSPLTDDSPVSRHKRQLASNGIRAMDDKTEGCKVENRTLKIGEAIPLQGCGQKICTIEQNVLYLVIERCDSSAVALPENCVLVPNSEDHFPECCIVEHACTKIVKKVFPVVVTAANISDLEINVLDNMVEPSGGIGGAENETPNQVTVATEVEPPPVLVDVAIPRQRREAVPTNQSPENPSTEVEDCTFGNKTLVSGEIISLKGCAQMKCTAEEDFLLLVVLSCESSKTDSVPEGDCRRVYDSEEKYPECCTAKYICVNNVIVSTYFTAANISQLQINETDNLIGANHRTFVTDNLNVKVLKNNEIATNREPPKGAFEEHVVNRQKRELTQISTSTEQPNEGVHGCLIGNKTLMVGENIAMKGCAHMTCILEENEFSLVVETCDISKVDVQEGCQIQPPSEQEYPKCCEVNIVCLKIIESFFPIVFTAANISKLEKDKLNDWDQDTFITANLSGAAIEINHEPLSRSPNKRKVPSATVVPLKPDEEIEDCKFDNNRTLKFGEIAPVDGCGQVKCIQYGNGSALYHQSCDLSQEDVDEDCMLLPLTIFEFPKCCVRYMTCRVNVTNLVPVNDPPANIIELEYNDVETFHEENISVAPEEQDKMSEDNASEIRFRKQTREAKDQPLSEGCVVNNRTVKIGEYIPTKRCTETKCVIGDNGAYLQTARCDLSQVKIAENCKELPPASLEFPKCCIVVISCPVIKVVSVHHSLAIVPKQSINDIELLNEDYLDLNPEEYDETFEDKTVSNEIRNGRQKRETTDQSLSEGCVMNNHTLKIGEHIPTKGCAQTECVSGDNGPNLVISSCDLSQVDIGENCHVLPPASLEFPKCCVLVLNCSKVVTDVVPVDHSLPSVPQRNSNDIELLRKDYLSLSPKEYNETSDNKTVYDKIQSGGQERETTNPLYSDGCVVNNRILKIGENIPAKGCSQTECVSTTNGSSLITWRCDLSKNDIGENCSALPPASPEFPTCCVRVLACSEVVTEVIPIYHSSPNVPEQGNSDTVLLSENYLRLNNKEYDETFEDKKVSAEIQERGQKKETVDQPLTEECLVNNRTLKIGEHIPAEGCAQTECVSTANGSSLTTWRCDISQVEIGKNCKALPPASLEFPKCCMRVFNCSEVVTKVLPVDNFLAIVPEQSSKDNELLNKDYLDLNLEEYDEIFEDKTVSHKIQNGGHKRETTDQTLSEGCVVNNHTLKIGEHIPAKGCAQTECVSTANGSSLITWGCDLLQANINDDCHALPPASLEFPKCCVRVFVCKKITVDLLPVNEALASVTELQSEIPDLILSDQDLNLHQNVAGRQKREANSGTLNETEYHKEDREGCMIGNRTLQNNEILPLKGCAQVKCTSEKDGLALVIVSCNQTASDVPEGCSVISKPEQQYPECCVVELVCKTVVTKVFSVVGNATNTKQLVRNEKDTKLHSKNKKFIGESHVTDKGTPELTMKTSEAKSAEDTVIKTNSNPRGRIRFSAPSALNNRITTFDYKEFIERSRRYVKPRADLSSARPTFTLPARKRINRKKDKYSDDQKEDQMALEMKDSEVVTATSTKPSKAEDLRKEEKESSNKITKTEKPKKRRRLSALLSARNLRRNSSLSESKNKTVDIDLNLDDQTAKLENKTKLKEDEKAEVSSRRPTIRNRYRDRNDSEAARIAQRRRIYATRLNRLRTTSKPKSQKEVTLTEEENKGEKESELNKNEEESTKSPNGDEDEKRKTGQKLIRTNFSLKKRIRNESRKGKMNETVSEVEAPKSKAEESKELTVSTKDIASETDNVKDSLEKKEEESKKLSVKAKVSKQKEGKAEKESEEEASPETRLQRKRKRPSMKDTQASEENESSEKRSTNSDRKKPSFTLKKLDVMKVEPTTETARGQKVFDLSKVDSKTVTKAPNRTNRRRVSSPSKLLRQRLKEKANEEDKRKGTDQKTRHPPKPEPTQILPLPTPYSNGRVSTSTISLPSHPYAHNYYTDTPFFTKFENTLEDFEKSYEFPVDNLDFSSSDKDAAQSPDTEENEIPEIPKVPLKVTTLTFTTSRRSFKSSKTRNTSKNFQETPTVYGSEETYKALAFR